MLSPTMQGKRITVYVCGDPFMRGKQITLNTHQYPQFDRFCDYLTETVPNRTGGCYRRVYTPNGSEVRALDQIEAGREYVASKDFYRKISNDFNYRDIADKTRIRRGNKGYKKIDYLKRYQPVQHAHEEKLRRKSGRSLYLGEHAGAKIIRLHLNGFEQEPARTIHLPNRFKDDMDQFRKEVVQALQTKYNFRMFNIINGGQYAENFQEIHDVSEIEHFGHVLIVPTGGEKVKNNVYYNIHGKQNFRITTSPRAGQAHNFPPFPEVGQQYRHSRNLNKHRPLPSIPPSNNSTSKQSDSVSPFSNPPSHYGHGGRRSKGRAQNVDYDKDQGGVYRAKGQNNSYGAQQVKESHDTHTERPIDQMEAEEVEEEEEHKKSEKGTPIPPGTELNKQPSIETKQSDKGINASQEEKNEDDGIHRIDEFQDQSFGNDRNYGGNSPLNNSESNNPRASTPHTRGEPDPKDQQQRDYEAASILQAGARGHQTRQEHQQRVADREQSDHEVDNERGQSEMRGQSEVHNDDDDFDEERRRQEEAATKIQAGVRGLQTRKAMEARKAQGQK